MSISRRKFLGTGTLAVLTAALPVKALANELAKSSGSTFTGGSAAGTFTLDSAAFTRCLNTKFRLRKLNADSAVVKLVAVNQWQSGSSNSRSKAVGRECFSAMFLGSHDAPLQQDTYSAEHESLGNFQIMIVPMGMSEQGVYYEAVFNRLH